MMEKAEEGWTKKSRKRKLKRLRKGPDLQGYLSRDLTLSRLPSSGGLVRVYGSIYSEYTLFFVKQCALVRGTFQWKLYLSLDDCHGSLRLYCSSLSS